MDTSMNVGLIEEIIAELTIEFRNEPAFDAEVLKIKVNDAYRKVRGRKCYENTSYSEQQIEKDLHDRHFQDIKDVAKYNYVTDGAEFEQSHNENNVSRTWRSENDVLGNITAFVKVF